VKGRKRHVLVDTQGFVLKVIVHPADIHDRDGGLRLLEGNITEQFPRLRHLWVDMGYRGRFVQWVKANLHELLPTTGETWIYLSMSRLMLRRLAKANT
jgi:putative transposase